MLKINLIKKIKLLNKILKYNLYSFLCDYMWNGEYNSESMNNLQGEENDCKQSFFTLVIPFFSIDGRKLYHVTCSIVATSKKKERWKIEAPNRTEKWWAVKILAHECT